MLPFNFGSDEKSEKLFLAINKHLHTLPFTHSHILFYVIAMMPPRRTDNSQKWEMYRSKCKRHANTLSSSVPPHCRKLFDKSSPRAEAKRAKVEVRELWIKADVFSTEARKIILQAWEYTLRQINPRSVSHHPTDIVKINVGNLDEGWRRRLQCSIILHKNVFFLSSWVF